MTDKTLEKTIRYLIEQTANIEPNVNKRIGVLEAEIAGLKDQMDKEIAVELSETNKQNDKDYQVLLNNRNSLIGENARLQKEKDALEAENKRLNDALKESSDEFLDGENDKLVEENARLREALKKSVACVNHLVDGCNCLDLEKKALEESK